MKILKKLLVLFVIMGLLLSMNIGSVCSALEYREYSTTINLSCPCGYYTDTADVTIYYTVNGSTKRITDASVNYGNAEVFRLSTGFVTFRTTNQCTYCYFEATCRITTSQLP